MKNAATLILIGFSLCCSLASGADSAVPAKTGYHCLFVGHSYFIPVIDRFKTLPGQCGIVNHRQQKVYVGGAGGSVRRLWEKDSSRLKIQKILVTGKIELLGMTYHGSANSSRFEDFERWVDFALKHNPQAAFFFGHRWESRGPTTKLSDYKETSRKNSADLYVTVEKLRKLHPKNKKKSPTMAWPPSN